MCTVACISESKDGAKSGYYGYYDAVYTAVWWSLVLVHGLSSD
jgi:hypothetical protein